MTGDDADWEALYRDDIQELANDVRVKAPLAREDVHTQGMNPLCGDTSEIGLAAEQDGQISGVHVGGVGCSISRASGTIMHDLILGHTSEEAHRYVEQVKATFRGEDPPEAEEVRSALEPLSGLKKNPVRLKCALLPWTTLDQALTELEAKGGKS